MPNEYTLEELQAIEEFENKQFRWVGKLVNPPGLGPGEC